VEDFDFSAAEQSAEETLQTEAVEVQSEEVQPEEQGESTTTQEFEYFDPEKAEKTLFKIRHGDKELDVPFDELKDLAEKGFDYTQKRQQDAELLKWAEEAKPKMEAYEQFGQYLRNDPLAAKVLAALDNPQMRQTLAGMFGEQVNLNQPSPRELQLQQELEQLKQQQQQFELEQQANQLAGKLQSEYESLEQKYPSIFKGPMANLNKWKLQQAVEKQIAEGHAPSIKTAFFDTFGDQIDQTAVNSYISDKKRGAPKVSKGGTPPGTQSKPKNTGDAWEQAEQSAFQRFQESLD